ncbi:MAG TPA: patatin-like phospholipase family protein [Opitutaceae bacterium]|nr:patatin-like phospholipase family protein [Opitutaceae bacterium]
MNPAEQNALLLVGGGARAAYQVGVLRSLAKSFPELRFPILTGVSAGAINVAMLANSPDEFPRATEHLVSLWENLTIDKVFRTQFRSLGSKFLRWMVRSAAGRAHRMPPIREMVDTAPLRSLLQSTFNAPDGILHGIEANLRSGRLSAVGITTTKYPSGQSTTWTQSLDEESWHRVGRRGEPTTLTVEHVMASSALPLIFPAAQLSDGWYGDGGIRLTAPLSPAVELGADRVLAISTLTAPGPIVSNTPFPNYPPAATILGVLLESIFLDMLDADATELRQLNQLIADNPRSKEFGLRPVDVLVMRPSEDLRTLAHEFEPELPKSLRHVFQALGSRESNRSDLIATLLFQPRYLKRVMEIGEKDGARRRDELAVFFGFDGGARRTKSASAIKHGGGNGHEGGAAIEQPVFSTARTGTDN